MGYRSTLWNGYHLQRQAGHRFPPISFYSFLFLSLSLLSYFLSLSVSFSFSLIPFRSRAFHPRAKLLMNIGPKYQSTGI